MTKPTFKQFLEAVDRNKLLPQERKKTPPSWLEGVMLEFIVAGLHAEFVSYGRLRSIFKITQFSTGQHVGNLYFVKHHDTYYCQVNEALPTGKDGRVVWRGTVNHTWPRKPKPADVEANKTIVLELLMQAVRKSRSMLPLVEGEETDEFEYAVHLGDGVIAQLNSYKQSGDVTSLRGKLHDMHDRFEKNAVAIWVFSQGGETLLTVDADVNSKQIRTCKKHPRDNPSLLVRDVHSHKSELLSITKELVGLE